MSVMYQVRHESDPVQRVHLAVETLNELLHQALHEEERPVLLLLSASAEPGIFRTLECIHTDNLTKGLTISVLDERLSRASSENTCIQLSQSPLYPDAKDYGVRFLPTVPEEREMLQQFATRIDQEFRDWHAVHREGRIFTVQGIGSDGSTAGLQVTLTPEDFNKSYGGREWIIGTNQTRNQPFQRLSPTPSFLAEMVDATIVCIPNEGKEWALRELEKEAFRDELFTLPARVFHAMADVRLFCASPS